MNFVRVEEWWLRYAYLSSRAPIAGLVSFYAVFDRSLTHPGIFGFLFFLITKDDMRIILHRRGTNDIRHANGETRLR